MPTNLELAKKIIENGTDAELHAALRNMAQRLDIIANMNPESPVGQLQLITGSVFFYPR
jgi:hypothetical protein